MIKRPAFDYLLTCFERAQDCERISELKLYFPHLWQDLIASGALIPKGSASDRLIMVDLPDDESDGFRQVYREKGRFVYYYHGRHEVTDDDLRMYQYSMNWFPEWLSTQLQLDKPERLLRSLVWRLGERKGVTIILVRDFERSFDPIADFIEEQGYRACVVISKYQLRSKRLMLSPGCQLLPLNEILPVGPVKVDYNRFLSYIDPEQARLEREGIIWDEENAILRVLGHEPWVLKGAPERCQLISQLYQAGKYTGSPRVLTQLALENVKSANLSQFFNKDGRWNEFIDYERGASGCCWLKYFIESKAPETVI